MSCSWEKQKTDSVEWTKNHSFRKQKMGQYRGFIWRPARPRSWKSYCLMVRQKSAVFSPHIASKPFKVCIFIVAIWPVLFFTLRNGVVRRPIVCEPGGCWWRCLSGPGGLQWLSLIFLPFTRPWASLFETLKFFQNI